MIQASTPIELESLKAWLRQRLSPERFSHSVGAHDKALEIAHQFQLSPTLKSKIALASLLHDAAKLLSPQELFQYADDHGLVLEDVDRQTPQTLHPFVGAEMVKTEFEIQDEEVLNAIRYHTTGRAGMSLVEKIVYIADKIEGNTRNPLYIQKVSATLDFKEVNSVDYTMLFILDSTIAFLMDKHQVIHPRTIEARNDFIALLKREGRL